MVTPQRGRARPDDAPPVGSVLDRDHAVVTIGAVALVTIAAFENLAVTTAMPVLAEALGGLTLYALAFGAPMATAIIGMVLSGQWNDVRGPAGPLKLGALLFTGGLLIAGTAQSMIQVTAGRAVQGFGSGVIIVALYVLVARVYPDELRPRIFAAFAAAWVLPALVGPTVSGLTVEHLGWRWVFLGVAGLVPIAAVMVRPGLKRSAPAATAHDARILTPRLAWATGAGVAASLLHMAGQASALTAVVLLVAGLAGVAVGAPRLLPAGTFTARPGLPAVIALRGIAAGAFMGAEVFIPLLLVRERGLSPAAAGIVLTIGAVTWSTGSWLQGRSFLPNRRNRLRFGMMLITTSIAAVTLIVQPEVPLAVGFAGWALGGLGMGLVYPTLSVLVLELSTPQNRGANSSSLQISDSLFTTLVLAVTGTVFAALLTHSDTLPFVVGFALTGAVAAIGVVVAGRTRAPGETRAPVPGEAGASDTSPG